jgi:hypothetical protein
MGSFWGVIVTILSSLDISKDLHNTKKTYLEFLFDFFDLLGLMCFKSAAIALNLRFDAVTGVGAGAAAGGAVAEGAAAAGRAVGMMVGKRRVRIFESGSDLGE